MIVYIAGPITGNENYHAEFAAAAAELFDKGHIVFNPASLPTGLPWEEYMPICFAMMDVCDAVYFLKGWEHSKGARIEFNRATKHGMQLIFGEDDNNAS